MECAFSRMVDFLKGKSTIQLTGVYGKQKRNFAGSISEARGY